MPIHSKRVDLVFHRGRACNASNVLASADVMALVLSIKRGLFFVGDVIRLALPTNLHKMDGLKRGGRRGDFCLILWGLISSLSVASCSFRSTF
jgi:hypothetical protein